MAYSFARFEYRGRDALFMITLGTMMLPAQVTLIPQFVLFYQLGWINTFLPLWVPHWFGGGAFANIDQNQGTVNVPTPFDEQLAKLRRRAHTALCSARWLLMSAVEESLNAEVLMRRVEVWRTSSTHWGTWLR